MGKSKSKEQTEMPRDDQEPANPPERPQPERQLAPAGGFLAQERTTPQQSALAAREQGMIQAACVMAVQNPRNEAKCWEIIQASCKRPTFAEKARYVFPRGGETVSGPSVQLAREIFRIWGHARAGYNVISRDPDYTTLEGYAWDLQTGAYITQQLTIENVVHRKGRGTIRISTLKDPEREFREVCAKAGAVLLRNCILQIVPRDIVDDAQLLCQDTLEAAAKGQIKQDPRAAVRRLIAAFKDLMVDTEMLAAYVKGPLDSITPEQLTELRGIYTSLHDGNSKVGEHFKRPEQKEPDKPRTLDDVDFDG